MNKTIIALDVTNEPRTAPVNALGGSSSTDVPLPMPRPPRRNDRRISLRLPLDNMLFTSKAITGEQLQLPSGCDGYEAIGAWLGLLNGTAKTRLEIKTW